MPFGPQPQVHPKHLAFGGWLGQSSDDGLRQPNEVLFVEHHGLREADAGGFAVPRIKEQEINIRAVVQLSATELAERNNAEPAANHASLRVMILRLTITLGELLIGVKKSLGENHIGKPRKLQG